MKRFFFFPVIICICLLFYNCGKHLTKPEATGNSALNVWAHIIKRTDGLAKTAATTWDSLVVRISSTSSSPDMDIIQHAFKFDANDPFVNCTLNDIPSGKGRFVETWTKNSQGLVIHAAPGKKVDLASGEMRTLDFTLLPKRGSIYVDISNVPISVAGDTMILVTASFVFGGQFLSDSVKRSKNVYLTIDNVPDSASGILSIAGIGASKDTLYRYSMPMTFFALRDTSISARLEQAGTGISMNITAYQPAATIISASMDQRNTSDVENGPCIITEIMYSANDSEYVEIYNTLTKDTAFDTLILDIDGMFRFFSSLSIKAKGFFVFGRKSLPWVDVTHTVASALDLLSGGGNTIVLRAKDSSAMDRVSFGGGTNDQEWPNASSGKKSIILDSLVSDPTYNNFGKNWLAAQTLINKVDLSYASPTTSQYGTPGYSGR